MYKVIKNFADLQDGGYRYNVGDTYPREGFEASEKRIEQLLGSKNRQKTSLIKKTRSKEKEPIDEVAEALENESVEAASSVDPSEYAEALEEKPAPKPRGRKKKEN